MTDAEARLWYRLRNRNTSDYKFRRQHPIGPYILDFYCEYKHLAIEVDGSQHSERGYADHDAVRSTYLERQGLRVLRFDNLQVLRETDAVMSVIFEALESPHPPPLPRGEGTSNTPAQTVQEQN